MTGVERLVAQFTSEEREQLIALRRALHQVPEPAWGELKTQALLRAALDRAGITVVREVAKTGLIASIPGTKKHRPVIAIRGDIDGLPILEETGLPFASQTPGMMHACGHDMHATWTVAAGMLLARSPAVGEVRLVLQPAEEVGEGAAKVLASGALGVSRDACLTFPIEALFKKLCLSSTLLSQGVILFFVQELHQCSWRGTGVRSKCLMHS